MKEDAPTDRLSSTKEVRSGEVDDVAIDALVRGESELARRRANCQARWALILGSSEVGLGSAFSLRQRIPSLGSSRPGPSGPLTLPFACRAVETSRCSRGEAVLLAADRCLREGGVFRARAQITRGPGNCDVRMFE